MYKVSDYLLAGPLDSSYDHVLYWSITEGWTMRENATRFCFEETETFEKPPGALGWVRDQDIAYKKFF